MRGLDTSRLMATPGTPESEHVDHKSATRDDRGSFEPYSDPCIFRMLSLRKREERRD